MKICKVLITLFIVSFVWSQAEDVKIIVPNTVKSEIKNVAAIVKSVVPTTYEVLEKKRLLFKTWVSGSIDLQKAKKRESKRFMRTSFTQEVIKEKLRTTKERLKMIREQKRLKPQLLLHEIQVKELTKPTRVLYREGPMYFQFIKFKKLMANVPLSKDEAISMAREFCIANKFIEETPKDKIGRIDVIERRINEERGEGEKSDDYLVQQDVVFERWYEGKPVINSKIVMGLHPTTKEIIQFKHFNWVPLKEESTKRISQQELKKVKTATTEEIQKRIEGKIRRISGNFLRAEIKKVVPAWFQTNEKLIPVLVFEVELEFPRQEAREKRSYLEAINLVGSDDVFYKDYRTAQRPVRVK